MDEYEKARVVEKLIKLYQDSINDRQIWRNRINGSLLLICVTLFSIVISLSAPSIDSCYSLLFYRLALILNALCIILLWISVYSQLKLCDQSVRKVSELLKSQGEGIINTGRILLGGQINIPSFYMYCAKVSYVCFFIMIILYTVFALTK